MAKSSRKKLKGGVSAEKTKKSRKSAKIVECIDCLSELHKLQSVLLAQLKKEI
jgi:hypothetical protein